MLGAFMFTFFWLSAGASAMPRQRLRDDMEIPPDAEHAEVQLLDVSEEQAKTKPAAAETQGRPSFEDLSGVWRQVWEAYMGGRQNTSHLAASMSTVEERPSRRTRFVIKPKHRPNLVFFLTDDQDQLLGGSFPVAQGQATPMPKTKRLMQDEGIYANHFYAHTPICSPSRSELLTGRYFHNIKQTGGSGYCHGMHVNHKFVHKNTFMRVLKEEGGYTTGLFGKYVNRMPDGMPEGFDAWFANDGSSYIAPAFQVDGIDGLPTGTVRYSNSPGNYSTSVIGNVSIAWIKQAASTGKPFMAYIAPKSAHEPFNPAPWYRDSWDPSWPETEPRGENWNCSSESRVGHIGNIPKNPYLTEETASVVTGIFKNRWRTLMSVDDLIADVIQAVDDLGLSDNTYFFFTSDHGFQLGQFNIPMDKRHVYEWDTKVHLLIRGPGVRKGQRFDAPATMVDLAPTLLGLAGLHDPEMDGRSIVPFFVRQLESAPSSVYAHIEQLGGTEKWRAGWRKEVFLEYYFCNPNKKCFGKACSGRGDYPRSDSFCTNLTDNTQCWCPAPVGDTTCYDTEDDHNNFIAIRRPGPGRENWLYAEYQTGNQARVNITFDQIQFQSYFDLHADPWHMHNLFFDNRVKASTTLLLKMKLREWLSCQGATCP